MAGEVYSPPECGTLSHWFYLLDTMAGHRRGEVFSLGLIAYPDRVN